MSPSMKTKSAASRSKWTKLYWIVPAILVGLLAVVLAAKGLRGLPAVQDFLAAYPGHSDLPEGAPVGFPAWLAWQHFLNALLILLIIRSGWQVRTVTRPPSYWTRNNRGLIKTKNPPQKMSLHLWFHLSLDVLWVLNGLAFYILLFATGQWTRVVPTSWDVFPNAVSAGLQYASLDWPLENGWVNYNALQLLTYFATIFIAAPLAIITGLRMSSAWPKQAGINKVYPIELARAIHLPVMFYFVAFIIVHVALVLATGALRNLNHMYAARDDGGWLGFWIFAASLVVMAAAWIAARPVLLRPVAALMGKISR
ncbi:thiosulfate reductase cytochrome subunit beta (membrane anchoring protein) [Arthrobacter crystallopoietes BAB-32]|uniref:Thiosulfate reductase cytochrome subunit beta (Membrane anchoring protein) n=1 Tax=Arthrobacter crystallopoietes BAB-32 TaxID=1246476 RepID=N1V4T7_9MICC|nr:cytochrome b/b6 domain-containing protein [Arthrobacter crystallopoietes]EMY35034.1 thiosulfate reductase cytochrome subunit beta (membrane anchoring protein) [Arthrobacter crystallopoietes BAB-32]